MTRWTIGVGCAVLALGAVATADVSTKNEKRKDQSKATEKVVFLKSSDIKFGPAPADLPKGAQLAVLQGDPMKSGPYTIRLKLPDGLKIPEHSHSQAETLTVLEGTLRLYLGDTTSEPHDLDKLAFHSLPAGMKHSAQAQGETVVQIQGTGPFDIHYLGEHPQSAKR